MLDRGGISDHEQAKDSPEGSIPGPYLCGNTCLFGNWNWMDVPAASVS